MGLSDGLGLPKINLGSWVWHQLSLPTDYPIWKPDKNRAEPRLLVWTHVELLQACQRCRTLSSLTNTSVRYKRFKSESKQPLTPGNLIKGFICQLIVAVRVVLHYVKEHTLQLVLIVLFSIGRPKPVHASCNNSVIMQDVLQKSISCD